jgi:CubicO group peptidase (beta-lactamase class C family)
MKTKAITFFLFVLALLWVISSSALTESRIANAQSPDVSKNSSLGERISRVENGLSPQNSKGKSSSSTFKLTERMKFYKTPGVSVAVINNGTIEWARGYGVREAGKTEPVNPETLFQAASISKPVTATATLKLVQGGVLKLDDDVNQKLTSWKVPNNRFTKDQKVTLRNILSHSAGLTVPGFDGYIVGEQIPTLPQILNGAKPANSGAVKVDHQPNQKFRYSGGGYVIVQQLLSDVTGKPFNEFMKEIILDKLGMTSSTYQQPLPESKRMLAASGHDDRGGVIRGAWRIYPEMSAAGLWTTPSDLARFEIQKSANRESSGVLNQKITNEMLTPQIGGWGLGFELPGKGKSARFIHSGLNEGFKSVMIAFKNTGQGAVVMTNSDKGIQLAIEIIKSISNEYGWPRD